MEVLVHQQLINYNGPPLISKDRTLVKEGVLELVSLTDFNNQKIVRPSNVAEPVRLGFFLFTDLIIFTRIVDPPAAATAGASAAAAIVNVWFSFSFVLLSDFINHGGHGEHGVSRSPIGLRLFFWISYENEQF
jgi:hypothetical protein